MITFIKDSTRELKHVVWPTKAETQSYFITVLVVLVLFWIYLTLVNAVFKAIIFDYLAKIF